MSQPATQQPAVGSAKDLHVPEHDRGDAELVAVWEVMRQSMTKANAVWCLACMTWFKYKNEASLKRHCKNLHYTKDGKVYSKRRDRAAAAMPPDAKKRTATSPPPQEQDPKRRAVPGPQRSAVAATTPSTAQPPKPSAPPPIAPPLKNHAVPPIASLPKKPAVSPIAPPPRKPTTTPIPPPVRKSVTTPIAPPPPKPVTNPAPSPSLKHVKTPVVPPPSKPVVTPVAPPVKKPAASPTAAPPAQTSAMAPKAPATTTAPIAMPASRRDTSKTRKQPIVPPIPVPSNIVPSNQKKPTSSPNAPQEKKPLKTVQTPKTTTKLPPAKPSHPDAQREPRAGGDRERGYKLAKISKKAARVANRAQRLLYDTTQLLFYDVAFLVPRSEAEAVAITRGAIPDNDKSENRKKIFLMSWAHSQFFQAEMAALGYKFITARIKREPKLQRLPKVEDWLQLRVPLTADPKIAGKRAKIATPPTPRPAKAPRVDKQALGTELKKLAAEGEGVHKSTPANENGAHSNTQATEKKKNGSIPVVDLTL